ncbi:hypothetical protein CWT12_06360 [Actinomyces sp. 432]|uniref:hypothetical protein n=1 Tax=Actinomyces sp. 432 TaxID=2057798 RepID=UPI001374572D|nr:hypothetical protein [Actinomyces sp. 432]QHO91012.1 hypothetical protein CWT12_06360 [Actinomyces sp. 432]
MTAPAPGPQKKPIWKRWWFIAAAVVIAVVVIAQLSGGSDTSSDTETTAATSETQSEQASGDDTSTDEEEAEETPSKTITLKAEASGSGTVLWMHDGSSHSEDFTGEWSQELPYESGDWSVSVTGDIFNEDDSQTMSCEILVDGEQEDSSSGSGSAGSAYCSHYSLW